MEAVTVKASKSYEVLIGSGLLDQCAELTRAVHAPCKIMLVSDDTVFALYGERVKKAYEVSGFEVSTYCFKSGEASKNSTTLIDLVEQLAQNSLVKTDLVVALGGGVVGDLAGFAAAIYLRGIDFVGLPTTFLAAIDSSVGGKTGVDLPSGKNQMGAFHQPILVVCDTDTFKTLTPRIFSDGICEAIKYGVICDKDLFIKLLSNDIHANINDIVTRCVTIKSDIVSRDEFDCGERMVLNLGHTIGHAIEALSGYEISHGNGVAIGMLYIARACHKMGFAREDHSVEIVAIMDKYAINKTCNYQAADLARAAMSDKKRACNSISLVLIEEIGKAFVKKIPINELFEFIRIGQEDDSKVV